MKSSATAIWQGLLKEGKGALTARSYVLRAKPHSFVSRLDSRATTGGLALIAAAHVSCLARALSDGLVDTQDANEELRVSAEVTLDNILMQGWSVTSSHLVLVGKTSRIHSEAFANAEREDKPSSLVHVAG